MNAYDYGDNAMIITLSEIAKLLEGELLSSPDIRITGVSGLDEAVEPSPHPSPRGRGGKEGGTPGNGQIVVIANPSHLTMPIHASAIIIPENVSESS
ncbi:hypothetical protein HY793_03315, partial [Candidatus Desantisbacteria bacterium]|nr:hypothetical protein [Candidatus Desantisbacteria bacterium]